MYPFEKNKRKNFVFYSSLFSFSTDLCHTNHALTYTSLTSSILFILGEHSIRAGNILKIVSLKFLEVSMLDIRPELTASHPNLLNDLQFG
jgi:hypothetical protein